MQRLWRGLTVLRVSFGRAPVVEVPLFVHSVAAPAVTLDPGAHASFEVVGAAMGTAMLTVTLPAERGGTSVQVPVEVGEPLSKLRSAR